MSVASGFTSSLPDPAALLAALSTELGGLQTTRGFLVHGYVIIALFSIVILCGVAGSTLRWGTGRWWIRRVDAQGRRRLNSSLLVQGCLVSYSALWISFICVVYLKAGVGIPASKTFGFLVFLPLSFSGALPLATIQLHSILTALPSRRAAVSFHTPSQPTTLQGVLESRNLRALLVVVFPILAIASVAPTAVLAGVHQTRAYETGYVVERLLDGAAESGWSADSGSAILAGFAKMAMAIAFQLSFPLTSTVPQIYAPATFIVLQLLSDQINYLQRSIFDMAMLHTFGNDSTSPGVTSRPTSHDGGHPNLSTKVLSPAKSHFARSDYVTDDWGAKLVKLSLHRRVVVAQALATLSTALCFMGLSIFGVADGYSRVSGEMSRNITLFVSAYAFLVTVLPCSILFVYLSAHPSSTSRPAPAGVPFPSDETGSDPVYSSGLSRSSTVSKPSVVALAPGQRDSTMARRGSLGIHLETTIQNKTEELEWGEEWGDVSRDGKRWFTV